MLCNFGVEFFGSVFLPEPEEDFAEAGRPRLARCVGVPVVADAMVDFRDMAGGELLRRLRTSLANDGSCGPPIGMTVLFVTVLCDEERSQLRTAPFCFGLDTSFCSAS
jgi:hypothetical protein